MIDYISVCDGIGAVHVAWQPLGWKCRGVSEIEPFPSAVVDHRWGFENYGDFTRIEKNDRPRVHAVRLLAGGTPCQSFSLAGKREGLDDERGYLTLEYAELAHRLGSQWLVWENVPGIFSIDDGWTFAAFLSVLSGSIVEVPEGGWSNAGTVETPGHGYGLAWRVLDAQFAGVPQRRRRVFVIGYLGDHRPAAAVLFERQCLQGDTAPSREAGQRIAAPLTSGAGSGRTNAAGRWQEDDENIVTPFSIGPDKGEFIETATTMDVRSKNGVMQNQLGVGVLEQTAFGGNNSSRSLDVATACNHHRSRMDFESETLVVEALPAHSKKHGHAMTTHLVTPYNLHGANSNAMNGGEAAAALETETARTVDTQGFTVQQGGTVVAFDTTQITSDKNYSNPKEGDPCHPLAESAHPPAIAYQCHGSNVGPMGTLRRGNGADCVPFVCNDGAQAFRAQGQDGFTPSEVSPPLAADADKGDQEPLVFTERTRDGERNFETSPIANALCNPASGGRTDSRSVFARSAVRRLTPTECERLQGFPDGYTLIPWQKAKFKDVLDFVQMCHYYRQLYPELSDGQVRQLASDSPRYRGLGNSMAVPVMRWLGERIQMCDDLLKELGR